MDLEPLSGAMSRAADDAPAQSDNRRRTERHVSVLVLAKVSSDGLAQMCKVRDISANGMRIETRAALVPDQWLTVEFRSGRNVEGVVRWVEGQAAGIEFNAPTAIETLLGHADRTTIEPRTRLPRFDRSAGVVIGGDQRTRPARLLNISLTGACLGETDAFRSGDPVVVTIAGLSPHGAEVVWVDGDRLGVRFLQPFGLAEFNAWLVA